MNDSIKGEDSFDNKVREAKSLSEVGWLNLEDIVRAAKSLRDSEKKDGKPSIHAHLIDMMIKAFENRDVKELERIANEEDVFAYTGNIKSCLEMIKSTE